MPRIAFPRLRDHTPRIQSAPRTTHLNTILMVGALEPCLCRCAGPLSFASSTGKRLSSRLCAVIDLRACWERHGIIRINQHAFLAKLETLEKQARIAVCNSARDRALEHHQDVFASELAERGAATIPTLWRETVTVIRARYRGYGHVFETDRIVVKRQIGAGAEGQELLTARIAARP